MTLRLDGYKDLSVAVDPAMTEALAVTLHAARPEPVVEPASPAKKVRRSKRRGKRKAPAKVAPKKKTGGGGVLYDDALK